MTVDNLDWSWAPLVEEYFPTQDVPFIPYFRLVIESTGSCTFHWIVIFLRYDDAD